MREEEGWQERQRVRSRTRREEQMEDVAAGNWMAPLLAARPAVLHCFGGSSDPLDPFVL